MPEYKDTTELSKQIADFKKTIESPNSDYMTGYLSALSVTEGMIAGLPTADVVEVKHGYWKEPKGGGYQCSNCRAFFDDYYGFNAKERCIYCPTCSAKMDLKEGAEE